MWRAYFRAFLRLAAEILAPPLTWVFIYLDAHWEDDLPLAEELRIIAGAWRSAVVMIDDFQVSDDDGYGFDDFGPGKALTQSYLPKEDLAGWELYYPRARCLRKRAVGAVAGWWFRRY